MPRDAICPLCGKVVARCLDRNRRYGDRWVLENHNVVTGPAGARTWGPCETSGSTLEEPWFQPRLLPESFNRDHFTAIVEALSSAAFQVVDDPKVHGFQPLSAKAGEEIQLFGLGYGNNDKRLAALREEPSLATTTTGGSVYPVILISDSSRPRDGLVPVGACSVVGYVGSAWSTSSTALSGFIEDQAKRGVFIVTTVVMSYEPLLFGSIWMGTIAPGLR
ncbi:hypothetical protein [Modestobacter sp. DSM 44400]|uniref:hypothetical protein n=1 Tax=Modestobacter sp. DSM 44400 TaxID=1550230 RepID=UPI0011153070|nr:hypothetical protein [Modestobacter sp. DSM 44400]